MSISHTWSRRRVAIAVGATAAALVTSTISAAPALADDPTTLTVVGTSDVFDSNLIQSVIKPGFEAANPGVTLNYISKGTGAAIAYAEAGSASALVVHAPSLENQFVDQGYSDNNAYGRAIFWGDYVLLGPTNDPLDIAGKYPHNIAGAFQRIAAQGALGRANFVSRGGTPGTTVQEHAIWALTNGVPTCTVSDVNGGGQVPSTTAVGGPCPTTPTNPSWYQTTGLTQGPNILAGDSCNFPNGNCYVLTDRGTFNYLQSINQAQNLKIVTRDNSPNVPGGVPLLVNSFHAYAVNPDKFAGNPNVHLNPDGAQAFLDYLQTPDAQTAIGNYLNGSNDPPFLPDASPRITTTALPATVNGGTSVTLRGTVSNVVPGTPALDNVPVTLAGVDANSVRTVIATTNTDSTGKYVFKFMPKVTSTYKVQTGTITKIEYPGLTPPFGDQLAPQSVTAGSTEVVAKVTITSSAAFPGALRVGGRLSPAVPDANATVTLYASIDGGDENPIGSFPVNAGDTTFSKKFTGLDPGTYTYRVRYADSPYVTFGFSATRTTVVP